MMKGKKFIKCNMSELYWISIEYGIKLREKKRTQIILHKYVLSVG